jgi:glutamine synthetase
MAGAGMVVESAKGECNLGQHEIAFRYAEALATCDNHSIYKTGAKEIADQAGMALTFMAKYDEREGNSCHIHISLRGEDGNVFPGDGPHGFSPLFAHFLAGQQACLHELTYLFAPNINSYKRYAAGSFARRRSAGAWTTARARCGSSGTAPGCGWRTGCRAATSTPTSRSPR